jgi:hypothetical protein
MKKSRLLGAVILCTALFTTPQAMSITIDTYFGWNLVTAGTSYSSTPNDPIPLATLQLESIVYIGAGGSVTLLNGVRAHLPLIFRGKCALTPFSHRLY